jgi:hypothetical protein
VHRAEGYGRSGRGDVIRARLWVPGPAGGPGEHHSVDGVAPSGRKGNMYSIVYIVGAVVILGVVLRWAGLY